MKRLLLFAALALAACGTAPPPPTQGAAARAEVDRLTKVYTDCIAGHADAVPLGDSPAGTIVDGIVRTCKTARAALVTTVADFDRIGHPKHSPTQAEAVAEASVATLEDALRQNAVVAIVKRQSAATPEGTKI